MSKMDKEKNILLVSARNLTRHGAQTSILNIVKASPKEYCFTWYCPGKEDHAFVEEACREGITVLLADWIYFTLPKRPSTGRW